MAETTTPGRSKEDVEYELRAMREERDHWKAQSFRPLGDNHHNALLCPHCNPSGAALRGEPQPAGERSVLTYWIIPALENGDIACALEHARALAAGPLPPQESPEPQGGEREREAETLLRAARTALETGEHLYPAWVQRTDAWLDGAALPPVGDDAGRDGLPRPGVSAHPCYVCGHPRNMHRVEGAGTRAYREVCPSTGYMPLAAASPPVGEPAPRPVDATKPEPWHGGRCPSCGDTWAQDPDDICEDPWHAQPRAVGCGCIRRPARYGTRIVTPCADHAHLDRDHRSGPAPTETQTTEVAP